MGFIERELEKLHSAMVAGIGDPRWPELYAAQQALSWALDPKSFRAPFDYLKNIPAGSGDCSVDIHRSPLPDTKAPRSGAV